MTEKATTGYECLARNEHDPAIKPEWSNQVTAKDSRNRSNRGGYMCLNGKLEEIVSIPREGTKDRKKFDLLIRAPASGLPGATLDEINRAVGHDAWSYINDTKRLAKRCQGLDQNLARLIATDALFECRGRMLERMRTAS